ncbi:glycosyltransferase family 4 protein [Alsobacter sp. SYSU BS001988]
MHVCLVAKYPVPSQATTGGVERVVEILRDELARDVKVTLVVPNAPSAFRHRDDAGDIIYLRRSPWPASLNYWNSASRDVHRIIEEIQPDIVHVHDLAGLSFRWPQRKLGRPQNVFTAHGVLENDILHGRARDPLRILSTKMRAWLVGQIERSSRRNFDRVIVISDYVFDAMPDVRDLKWAAIPNPVDRIFLGPVQPLVRDRSHLNLIQVGVMEPRKNILGAIEILREMIALGLDIRLDVVGRITDRVYEEQCRRAARLFDVENAVTFHGAATPAEIVAWMDRSDALLLTSKQETAPMVVAEAHCRGLPAAAPRAFGLVSMIDPSQNGVFIDQQRPAQNAERVKHLLERDLDRDAISRSARLRYGASAVVAQTLKVYAEALEEANA